MSKMEKVTATEANRSFSKLMERVRRGESFEITSHGRKVAVLQPAENEDGRVRPRRSPLCRSDGPSRSRSSLGRGPGKNCTNAIDK